MVDSKICKIDGKYCIILSNERQGTIVLDYQQCKDALWHLNIREDQLFKILVKENSNE